MRIEDLTAQQSQNLFMGAIILLHNPAGYTERFIVTVYGGRTLFVSMSFGFVYTRPQLIEKYQKISCKFLIERDRA